MKGKKDESKHEKFVRLAEARTNKIIDTLQLLGNCSNKAFYEYSKDEVDQIFQAIEIELKDAKRKFNPSTTGKSPRFTIK